jgi:hypothetical protein
MLILKNDISAKLWNVKRDIKRVHSKLNVIHRLQFKIIKKVELSNETMLVRTLNSEIDRKHVYTSSEMK